MEPDDGPWAPLMARLFGRQINRSHRLWKALNQLRRSRYDRYRALATNLAADLRVTEAREDDFMDHVSSLYPPPALLEATHLLKVLDDYHRVRVRAAKDPVFANDRINGLNFLRPRAAWNLVRRGIDLARIVTINERIAPVFLWASEQPARFPSFASFAAQDDPVVAWLTRQRAAIGNDETLVVSILSALNAYSAEVEPYQPSWVIRWSEIEPILSSPADQWLAAVGICPDQPCWVLVLKYAVRDVPTVMCRPTQLDAGSYPYHHPAPPLPSAVVGHPLALGAIVSDLSCEMIHGQIEHVAQHWVDAGRKFEWLDAFTVDLDHLRSRHRDLLEDRYGPRTITEWLA